MGKFSLREMIQIGQCHTDSEGQGKDFGANSSWLQSPWPLQRVCYWSLLRLHKLTYFPRRPSAAKCPIVRLSFYSSSSTQFGVGEKHNNIVYSVTMCPAACTLDISGYSQQPPWNAPVSERGNRVFLVLCAQPSAWHLEDIQLNWDAHLYPHSLEKERETLRS